jgi:GT2 family glycosyltransferase
MEKIFVVIVSFNEKNKTLRLLDQLKCQKGKFQITTIVVDNHSEDGFIRAIRKRKYKNNILVPLSRNLGYGRACNKGIRLALFHNATYLCFLNSDIKLPNNFFVDMLKNKTDIVGPVIKYKKNKKTIYDLGGMIDWRIGRIKHQEQIDSKFKALNNRIKPDYISGCCVIIKRAVFEKIGLFDERFFLYFEDADLQIRAIKNGFKLILDKKVEVLHELKGVSENTNKSFTNLFYNLQSNLLFILKYQRGKNLIFSLIYYIALVFKVLLNQI